MTVNKRQVPTVHIDAEDSFGAPQIKGSPERNLLMATLERAILDYVGNHDGEILAAEEWIFAAEEEHKPGVFTFAWVCEQLDLEAEKIAYVIKNMPKRGSRRIAPWYFKNEESLCA